uniref:NB-ARC domain-containing protein n=1 Tax=Leersia perrieri TaxID=77586 RepID=A0A0D9X7A7_9ORYZ
MVVETMVALLRAAGVRLLSPSPSQEESRNEPPWSKFDGDLPSMLPESSGGHPRNSIDEGQGTTLVVGEISPASSSPMERALVSAATGALRPVIKKLAILLEQNLFKGVRAREIKSLCKELEAVDAFILKMSEKEEYHDAQDKAWLKEVRELFYDMEDSLDEFMHRINRYGNPVGFIEKCKHSLTKMKDHPRIAKAIEDVKTQTKEVAERHARYRNKEIISEANSNAMVDRRALAIFEDASKLVGIDVPKCELIEVLRVEDTCVSSQQTKVVSILGSGGMGKTTLANIAYQELKGQFNCWAFVSVSRNPDMIEVLRSILYQVGDESFLGGMDKADIQQLITKANQFLCDKRYLIVIDDIWKEDTWKTINYALPKNSEHSRIITTSRIHDVAKCCCSSNGDLVYKIRPLIPQDSQRLFHKRIFGFEEKCPSNLMIVSNKILEKCAGLPLAIISISSLLVTKPPSEKEWDQVYKSFGHVLGKNSIIEETMMQILSLSYFDLPHQLKSCLLYLSTFPEDFIIQKQRLIWRWVAEGFIQEDQLIYGEGNKLGELGERCFNELINRSLIQPCDINMDGEVMACRVHDTILDFITLKSVEDNFFAVSGSGYQMFNGVKVRQLSLHSRDQENVLLPKEMDLSRVRSFTAFSYFAELPSLLKLSFLRVVDLEGCKQLESHHLANIKTLIMLKYLGLSKTRAGELPEQIGSLKCLQTLNLQETKIKELPSSIIRLGRLVRLAIDNHVKLPDGIGSLTALEELEGVNVFRQSIEFLQELRKLTNLRILSLNVSSSFNMKCTTREHHYREPTTLAQLTSQRILNLFSSHNDYKMCAKPESHHKDYMDIILSSLCKLERLHSLCFHTDLTTLFSPNKLFVELCDYSLPSAFREFSYGDYISRIPNWIHYVVSLQRLSLNIKELKVEDVLSLGCLPVLEYLRLKVRKVFPGIRITISGENGFGFLRTFHFGCAIPVAFEAGAMPKLEKLWLLFDVLKTNQVSGNGDFAFGIQHLSNLQSIYCVFYTNVDDEFEMKKCWLYETVKAQMADNVTESEIYRFIHDELNAPTESAKAAITRELNVLPNSPKFDQLVTGTWLFGNLFRATSRMRKIRNRWIAGVIEEFKTGAA